MEDTLIDSGAIRRFAGIYLARDHNPDATTILAFRRFIERHQLAASMPPPPESEEAGGSTPFRGYRGGPRQ